MELSFFLLWKSSELTDVFLAFRKKNLAILEVQQKFKECFVDFTQIPSSSTCEQVCLSKFSKKSSGIFRKVLNANI